MWSGGQRGIDCSITGSTRANTMAFFVQSSTARWQLFIFVLMVTYAAGHVSYSATRDEVGDQRRLPSNEDDSHLGNNKHRHVSPTQVGRQTAHVDVGMVDVPDGIDVSSPSISSSSGYSGRRIASVTPVSARRRTTRQPTSGRRHARMRSTTMAPTGGYQDTPVVQSGMEGEQLVVESSAHALSSINSTVTDVASDRLLALIAHKLRKLQARRISEERVRLRRLQQRQQMQQSAAEQHRSDELLTSPPQNDRVSNRRRTNTPQRGATGSGRQHQQNNRRKPHETISSNAPARSQMRNRGGAMTTTESPVPVSVVEEFHGTGAATRDDESPSVR